MIYFIFMKNIINSDILYYIMHFYAKLLIHIKISYMTFEILFKHFDFKILAAMKTIWLLTKMGKKLASKSARSWK